MSDLISRADAIDAIAKYLKEDYIAHGQEPNERHARWGASVILEGIPSAQPKIVRCKECKWLRYCETEDLDFYLNCDHPDGGGIPRSEEWFCADGERMAANADQHTQHIESVESMQTERSESEQTDCQWK